MDLIPFGKKMGFSYYYTSFFAKWKALFEKLFERTVVTSVAVNLRSRTAVSTVMDGAC